MNVATESRTAQLQQEDIVYGLADSTTALYAARASGLYRSPDEGTTWQKITTSPTGDQAFSATAVISNGGHVFAGVYGGVLYSHDDGEYWQLATLPSPPPQITALTLSPAYAEDGIVAAGAAEDGVFISTDQGAHWTAWNFGLIDHAVYAVAVSPAFAVDRTVFAGTESGLFCSRNGGRGWDELPFPIDAAPILSLALSPGFASDGALYAGTEQNGLYVSQDYGISWQQIEVTAEMAVNAIHLTAPPSSQVWLLLEDRLVYSADSNRSWQPFNAQILESKSITSMLVRSDKLFVGLTSGDILIVQR